MLTNPRRSRKGESPSTGEFRNENWGLALTTRLSDRIRGSPSVRSASVAKNCISLGARINIGREIGKKDDLKDAEIV